MGNSEAEKNTCKKNWGGNIKMNCTRYRLR